VADEPGPGDVATPTTLRPAYYAAGRTGGWRDWWTLLHPPYTLWHLSYVVIGACLAPHIRVDRLVATVLAFLLAVGLAAHALDELHGRPLRTTIASRWLVVVAVLGIGGAVALGAVGVERTRCSPRMWPKRSDWHGRPCWRRWPRSGCRPLSGACPHRLASSVGGPWR